jgi:hypothetical protein
MRSTLAALLLLSAAAAAQEARVPTPFIASPDEVVERMLALARTGPEDFVIDLGSGDGRIVIAAAKKFGARGLGVDIDTTLVAQSRASALREGVAGRALFEQRDVRSTDVSRASVVTIYLLPNLIDELQPKLLEELKPGARIVTHAFPMKGWRADRTERVRLARPQPNQAEESVIFLWVVPASVRGEWQGGDLRLRIRQSFQEIELEASANGKLLTVREARLEGTEIAFSGGGFSFRGRVVGPRIEGELERAGRTVPLVFVRR